MLGKKIDWKQTGMLAAVLTASVYAISYLASLLGQQVTELFVSVPLTSVVTGTVGHKLMAFLGGFVSIPEFMGMAAITIFISSFIAILAGEFMIDRLKLPTFKRFLGLNGRIARLASVILYGAIPVYAVLIGITNPGLMAIVGVLIHTILVSALAVWIASLLKLKI